jgi:cytochrome c-type biogenesis protein CcmE
MNIRRVVKFAVPGLLMAAALVYLFISGMEGSMIYYLTLGEMAEKGDGMTGRLVRLAGKVKTNSVQRPAGGGPMTFLVTDGKRDLPVSFAGVVPETFQEGGEVLVEGRWKDEPVFVAATLIPKCPSKYETALEDKERNQQ